MTNTKQQKDFQIYIHRLPVGLQLGLQSPCVVLLLFVNIDIFYFTKLFVISSCLITILGN